MSWAAASGEGTRFGPAQKKEYVGEGGDTHGESVPQCPLATVRPTPRVWPRVRPTHKCMVTRPRRPAAQRVRRGFARARASFHAVTSNLSVSSWNDMTCTLCDELKAARASRQVAAVCHNAYTLRPGVRTQHMQIGTPDLTPHARTTYCFLPKRSQHVDKKRKK